MPFVPNALVRGVMTALRWIQPKLVQAESVASIDEAVTASVACLKSRGIVVEPRVVAGARRWTMLEAQRQDKVTAGAGR